MFDDERDARIGSRLSDYELIDVLATGGMARIYIGRDVNLEREVAVKVLTPEMMKADPLLAERFLREARSVAVLDHPNIIPIYQYGEQDNTYFLVMKLVKGGDLADEIFRLQQKRQQMPVKRMLSLMRQTAAALDHAHANGIIHRDIKPSNILIEGTSDRAILTDFGLVLRQTEIDKTMGTAFGTPRYISPEQALASERSVPQSDIYSLAVIVYEILTGTQVFRADTAMQVALSHISEKPLAPSSHNPKIPRAVEREILKALEKDPARRHRTATEFVEALADAYGSKAKIEAAAGADLKLPVSPQATIAPADDSLLNKTIADVEAQAPVGRQAGRKSGGRKGGGRAGSGRKAAAVAPDKPITPDATTAHGVEEVRQLQEIPPLELDPPTTGSQPDGQKKKRRVRPALFAGITAAVMLLAVLTILTGNGDPRSGRLTPAVIPAETGDPVELVVHYNADAFALANTSRATVSLSGFSVRRGSLPFDAAFEVNAQRLEPGECLLITVADRRASIPRQWNCDEPRNTIVRWQEALFWRGDDGTFRINLPDGRAECPLTETDEQECSVSLPTVVEADA